MPHAFREVGITLNWWTEPLLRIGSQKLSDADRTAIRHACLNALESLIAINIDTISETAAALDPARFRVTGAIFVSASPLSKVPASIWPRTAPSSPSAKSATPAVPRHFEAAERNQVSLNRTTSIIFLFAFPHPKNTPDEKAAYHNRNQTQR